ncbi:MULTISPECIES: hypothetical protein, partial [unclassified Bradyrhizobium]|uniref:hypothetical protein n=1 Tax=unclassified Bradyrhizobium TaxID=2631580 RepID=UPI0028E8FA47
AKTMVLPLKHCPPKSSRPIPEPKAEALNPETRKDSAVHVSLSSSSLVKQPALVSSLELISATSLVSFAVEVPVAGALHIADFERPSRAFLKKNSGASRKKKHQRKQRWSRKSGASVISDVRLAWW